MDKVGSIDLRHVAVADKQFKDCLGEGVPQDSTAKVQLESYLPNNLKYTVESGKGGVLVFSEVYYPGWKATIDGKEAPIGRVDYILRALRLEPGKHTVELDFHPTSIATTETIAYVAGGILILAIIAAFFQEFRKRKEKS